MKVKFLVDIGVFAKGAEVEMELARAQRYIEGGHAEAMFEAPPKKEEPKAEPKPKAKKEAKPKAKKKEKE